MVTTVECGKQAVRVRRIARNLVEINYSIEVSWDPNPGVHRLPIRLT